MKRLFFAIAILPWLLIACDTVTFEEPQPLTNETLKSVPEHMIGHYFDYDHDRDLLITPQLILTVNPTTDTIRINQISSDEKIKGDTLYNEKAFRPYKVVKINDTLFTGYRYLDTIFNIASSKQLLKAEGHDLFLNFQRDDNKWRVTRLAFRGDVVNIANIETETEVKMMEQITGSRRDPEKRLSVNPSNEQFNKFIDQNGFTKGDNYLKIDSLANHTL